jgi:PAS domain S-box-containing protein
VIDELRKSGRVNGREILLRSRSGQIGVCLFSAEAIEVRGVPCLLTVAEDITERKRAEEALRDANRALTAISAVNEAVLHKTEEPLLLQEVCRCIVEHAGYRMAWVGFLNDDEPKRIYPVAEAGFEQGYLQSIDVRCDDSERGRGPAGTAARTQKPAIVRNTATDAGFAPWRAEATARGYASVIGLPLVTGENLLGVLTIYSAQPDAFDQQEVHLLSELAGDLAFGIQALRTRAEQARAEEALIEERRLLHTLMDNLPDTIYFKDRESRFTRINKALANSFGLSDPAQAVGKTDFDFFTGEHAQQAYADEQEIIRTGRPMLAKEEKETWPDGRETWASTTKMPLRDANRDIIGTFGISRDITARKRAEEALLLSEEKFAKAFRSSPNAMAISTLEEGRFLEVNDGFLRQFGRQREDVVGRTAHELGVWLNPDDRVRVIDELRKSGRVNGRETLLRSRSGQIWVGLYSAEAIEVRGVHCQLTAVEDITERKRAEEALQLTAHQLAQAMDMASLAHWELDTATRIFTFNDRFYALYGTTAEREGGYQMSAETYAREFFFPEDMHIVAEGIAKGLATTDPDAAWTVEHRIRRRDGEIRHIVVRISVIKNSEGLTIKARGVNQDITERKRAEEALRESEERFRRFIENVPLGVCRTTPDGRVLMANPALLRMLGYDSWQELASRNLEDEAFEAGYPRSAFREQIEREGEVGGFEAAWKRRDGSVIFVRESARAFRADDGRVLYYDCIVEDVTERRRLGEQLRQSQKMEAIGCLAGGVAHDFNNLLTVVTGYSDLLLKRPPATCAGMRAPLEEIKKAAERAASLTRQLLTFSRKQMLQPQILDLNSLLTNVDEMLRRMIGEDIELVTHLPSGLGRVKADPGQIDQVIMNLAVNARDAMPQGGRLTLEAANIELDSSYGSSHESVLPGHYVMIAMSDTGIGMDAETQAHIFEPFFTTKEVGKGTGLGLATVYGIVKQSGGSVQVYSEPGKGTTFKVYLPRIDQAAEVIAPTNVPVDELSRGSETILLAEDEEAVRSLVRGVLESTGYRVLETKGGNEALEIGERHRKHIHLLLTDVVMPQMSGAELVKHLAPLHPETKVLYMSGYTDHAVVRHGLLDSSTAFLQKPFTPDALALKVREVLDGAARQGT